MENERPPTPEPLKLATVDGQPTTPEPPVRRRHRNEGRPRDKNGHLMPWTPTKAERRTVETCMAAGMTIEQVGRILGKSGRVLQTKCHREIENGAAVCNSKVVGKLFDKCMKGDTVSLLFWCKTRLGWQEKQRVEHTGADGGPIQHETVEAEAAAFTQRILSMAQRFQATAPDNDPAEAPAKPEQTAKKGA
jgi:hypothetical protein